MLFPTGQTTTEIKTLIAGLNNYFTLIAGPLAQSVELWKPCGGSTRPGYKSPEFEARRSLDVYGPHDTPGITHVMVAICGRPKPSEVNEGTCRARLCYAYVKHSILNSAIEHELRDRRGEGRVSATSFA